MSQSATPTVTTSKEPLAGSQKLFAAARKLMPGGVNSPVRAYQAVGCDPIFIRKGAGCRVTDVDGNQYIDYVGSYGPLILGHAAEEVVIALNKAVKHGTTFGMPTEAENMLAKRVIEAVPSIERVRFVNSGTEAAMSAIRLARAATGRDKIIKCIGCYHGHADPLLVQAGSGATTLGIPSSPGVPESITQHTVLVPFNDLAAARSAFEQHKSDIACFAVEPIAGNMGCIPPNEGYLEGLRALCDEFGALLLFDEVMTGFRVAYGGAQELYAVQPDITCLGKIVGGGLPCAAYGGREDLMRHVAPDGPMYQAGTLSGNPLAMAAGIAMLDALREGDVYADLETSSSRLVQGMKEAASQAGVPVICNRVGSMATVFFTDAPAVENYDHATACNTERFGQFFRAMLDAGVVLPPSQFEAWFISRAHNDAAISQTLEAVGKAMKAIAD